MSRWGNIVGTTYLLSQVWPMGQPDEPLPEECTPPDARATPGVLAEPAVARLQRSWSRLGEIPSLHEVTARSRSRGPSDQRS
jgi:hypothetical protein